MISSTDKYLTYIDISAIFASHMEVFEDKTYKAIDFKVEGLPKGKYDYCTFTNCNLSALDFYDNSFVECTFDDCDLSLCKTNGTIFTDVTFQNCKLLGIHFDTADQFLFSVAFNDCRLDNSVFFQMDLRKVKFENCRLFEVDLSEADCTKVVFDDCDLTKTVFDHTNLSGSDLRNTKGYQIDPVDNKIKGAKFSRVGLEGLLGRFGINID